MKVSRNWLQEYVGFDLPPIVELVEKIGAQLGAVEETVSIGAKYDGAVVARVVECHKMENSDHLNVCRIDDGGTTPAVNRGDDGLIQVVCGAPNVAAGLMVVWLPPGATVPSTYDSDPFVLEARELRGTLSNGMLASPKELSIGDSHEGILILNDHDAQPGASFADTYKLRDDIIDIENKMFTHRPDCFGQLGVAREVAGILGQQFVSPDWYVQPPQLSAGDGLPLTVQNELPELVPRFMAVALDGIAVGPSPVWLQTYLSRVGVRPINNVVDITNYMMLLTGQPQHAYDYDKVAALSDGDGATLVVRNPHSDESVALLNGKIIKPRVEAIMIATNKQAIALGGVMGGAETEVDATTRRIILECASFDMYSIRRTSMAHGIFSDAVTRNNKGQSPLQNPAVLGKTVELLQQLTGAQPASPVIDDRHTPQDQPTVSVTPEFINRRLGLSIGDDDIAQLLQNVEFTVSQTDGMLDITAPFWRTDIELREDVVEEVGRLYGFDKLPIQLPRRDITPGVRDPELDFKARVRTSLAKAGANEVLSYSFVHGKLLDNVGQKREQAFKLSNALSPDLQYYRLHALPSLLDKVHANIRAGYDEFALFELNKGHNLMHADDDDGVPTEMSFLDLVYANRMPAAGAPFYRVRRLLDALARDNGLQLRYAPVDDDSQAAVTEPYDRDRSAHVYSLHDDRYLGMIGEFKQSVLKNLKLPAYSAGCTIELDQLRQSARTAPNRYQQLSRFPKLEQDICLRVPGTVGYGQLEAFVERELQAAKPEGSRLTVSPLDIYRHPDSDRQQTTFRVSLAHFERTLTDTEVNRLLDDLAAKAGGAFGAERI